jgi:hypothetical protein
MPIGQSKYDMECEHVRKMTGARGVILMVIGGNCGHGMSCILPAALEPGVPEFLRHLAGMIEAETKQEAEAAKIN